MPRARRGRRGGGGRLAGRAARQRRQGVHRRSPPGTSRRDELADEIKALRARAARRARLPAADRVRRRAAEDAHRQDPADRAAPAGVRAGVSPAPIAAPPRRPGAERSRRSGGRPCHHRRSGGAPQPFRPHGRLGAGACATRRRRPAWRGAGVPPRGPRRWFRRRRRGSSGSPRWRSPAGSSGGGWWPASAPGGRCCGCRRGGGRRGARRRRAARRGGATRRTLAVTAVALVAALRRLGHPARPAQAARDGTSSPPGSRRARTRSAACGYRTPARTRGRGARSQFLGALLCVLLPALLALLAARARRRGYQFIALTGLIALVVSPVVSLGGARPLLLGGALAALTVAFLWLERLPLRPGLGSRAARRSRWRAPSRWPAWPTASSRGSTTRRSRRARAGRPAALPLVAALRPDRLAARRTRGPPGRRRRAARTGSCAPSRSSTASPGATGARTPARSDPALDLPYTWRSPPGVDRAPSASPSAAMEARRWRGGHDPARAAAAPGRSGRPASRACGARVRPFDAATPTPRASTCPTPTGGGARHLRRAAATPTSSGIDPPISRRGPRVAAADGGGLPVARGAGALPAVRPTARDRRARPIPRSTGRQRRRGAAQLAVRADLAARASGCRRGADAATTTSLSVARTCAGLQLLRAPAAAAGPARRRSTRSCSTAARVLPAVRGRDGAPAADGRRARARGRGFSPGGYSKRKALDRARHGRARLGRGVVRPLRLGRARPDAAGAPRPAP